MSQYAGWGIMVSHRSGETEDCVPAGKRDIGIGCHPPGVSVALVIGVVKTPLSP